MAEDAEPRIWASVGGTWQTRPFENVKIDIGVSGVPVNADDAYLQALLEGANVTIERTVQALAAQLVKEVEKHVRSGS